MKHRTAAQPRPILISDIRYAICEYYFVAGIGGFSMAAMPSKICAEQTVGKKKPAQRRRAESTSKEET